MASPNANNNSDGPEQQSSRHGLYRLKPALQVLVGIGLATWGILAVSAELPILLGWTSKGSAGELQIWYTIGHMASTVLGLGIFGAGVYAVVQRIYHKTATKQ